MTKMTMLYLINGVVINTTITVTFSGQWLVGLFVGWWLLGWVVSFLLGWLTGWLIGLSTGLQKNC